MDAPRIAIFDQWWPIRFFDAEVDPAVDEPDSWTEFLANPRFRFKHYNETEGIRYYEMDDARARHEVRRLVKFQTCPICRHGMLSIARIDGKPIVIFDTETLLLCNNCGYWGGRGHWDFGANATTGRPPRGVISRYRLIEPIDSASTAELVSHLRRTPHDATRISPLRAEKFVMDLLAEYLNCEVRVLGGVKDGGVDGYIVRGDTVSSIVQIKWHRDINRAESVRVVREVGGTLMARGVPNGIIVSNRLRFSQAAREEAQAMDGLNVEGVGRISLDLKDYHAILDMLELANIRLTSAMTVRDWFTVPDSICVFDGAALLGEDYIRALCDNPTLETYDTR